MGTEMENDIGRLSPKYSDVAFKADIKPEFIRPTEVQPEWREYQKALKKKELYE